MAEEPRVQVPQRGSPSVSRAVAILNLLAERPGGWSLTQIAQALGLAKSSTLTIMTSLDSARMVSRTDNGYELDVGVLTPASGFLAGVDVTARFKTAIAASTMLRAEVAHVAVLAGTEVIYIARHTGRPPLPVTAAVADRFPASITAAGTVLLAELSDDEVAERYCDESAFAQWTSRSTPDLPRLLEKLDRTRQDGYAIDDGETHPNVLGLAMAVRRYGNFADDISVSTSLRRDAVNARGRREALEELSRLRQILQAGNELR